MLPQKLLAYYNRELTYLRQYGATFAQRFPKIAKRLGFAEGASEDPHVERLVESFAFLTAKIHQRIDEDMPELNNTLLDTLAPQFLRQIPSVSLVQFQPDPRVSGVTSMMHVPRQTMLLSQPIGDVVCRFRTLYPLEILPLDLTTVVLAPEAHGRDFTLTLRFLRWPGAYFQTTRIRLYLYGPPVLTHSLYELLCTWIKQLTCQIGSVCHTLDARQVTPVGFDENDSLCADNQHIAPIHHHCRDYFNFPERFLFIDIPLPDVAPMAQASGELCYRFTLADCPALRRIERLCHKVNNDTFRLNCTPIVNLFTHQAEPIIPSEAEHEYLVQPDARRPQSMEVYTIDQVKIAHKEGEHLVMKPVSPLFGIDHTELDGTPRLFWQSWQRPSLHPHQPGVNVFIGFSTMTGQSTPSENDVVILSLTCTNRDIPQALNNGDPHGDFEPWRLVSQLTLNHMLFSGAQGVQVLKETLELYNVNASPAASRLVALLQQVQVEPIHARLRSADPHSLVKGLEVVLLFSAQAQEYVEFYLFCSVLERFIGMYAPINSFTRVITRIESVSDSEHRWPLRSGRLAWI